MIFTLSRRAYMPLSV